MRLDEIPVPDTPTARRAAEVCREFSPPALVQHALRSYLFAASRARLDGLAVDDELLYVAAVLHDLALEPPFDSHRAAFEDAGDALVQVFTAGAGWPGPRRRRAGAIVVAHMRGADPAVDPEGHLLDLATGLDIGGRGLEHWPRELVGQILAAHPRLDLAELFTARFRDQAARKPGCSAAAAVTGGIAGRIAANPLGSWPG